MFCIKIQYSFHFKLAFYVQKHVGTCGYFLFRILDVSF